MRCFVLVLLGLVAAIGPPSAAGIVYRHAEFVDGRPVATNADLRAIGLQDAISSIVVERGERTTHFNDGEFGVTVARRARCPRGCP